ncbi:hypothetical protein EVA_09321, partial [gut metagenome]
MTVSDRIESLLHPEYRFFSTDSV